ncbi:MAG: HAD hydrolase-like protein [Candidatus Marsarchaeota archaeon]|jgi:FMN phosphatase YigB (HAD superfamily)|nr:HAD hydrolase-like protein [Candidatus Marsarchaeota archaeon]MCL5112043.1 HAD hydrolase-like protein [Candidatus Marsarchaeota archaeon]
MTGLLKRYDTFIFDWDGTLVVGNPFLRLNEMLNPRWARRKRRSEELIDRYSVRMRKAGTLDGDAIRRHIKESERNKKMYTRLLDVVFYLTKPKLHNYSMEVIGKLSESNAKIALFTNGAAYRILKGLAYLKIEEYFEAIASAQDLGALKPNPLGLDVLIRSMHSRKSKSIYIGDMVSDVEAAKYAGISSCAIAKGFSTYAQLDGARPTYLFRSMESFEKAL